MFRHVERRKDDMLVQKVSNLVVEESRGRGRLKKKWMEVINEFVEQVKRWL